MVFFQTTRVPGAKMAYVFVLVFLHAAQASSFAIVPCGNYATTGFTMGLVGAGGSLGSSCFVQAFRNWDFNDAGTLIMGVLTLVSAGLSALIFIPGQSSLLRGGGGEDLDRTEHDAVVTTANMVEETQEDNSDEVHA